MDEQKDRTKIGTILGEISLFEFENDRPLLSALVIQSGKTTLVVDFMNYVSNLDLAKQKI